MPQINPLTALLKSHPFIVLDGALATELEARGCNLADSLWSAKVLMENPQLIRDVHLDYFRAGAQVAITASYQATPAGFAARGLTESQSRSLIEHSVASGHTVPIWPMALSIAVTTCVAPKNFRRFIVRGLKPCSMPAQICWPVKPYPRLQR
ncbi:MAG: mmuM [Enterobacteriaceae bacterium]|nr:mmuM [Enterobacteriaceae bacterium]